MKVFSKMPTEPEIVRTVLSFYLPGLFIQLGLGMTETFNPLFARHLGADIKMAGLIAAGMGIGGIIFDLPAGWIGSRVREKPFLIFSVLGLIISTFLRAGATAPMELFFYTLLFGLFTSAWGIGRLVYIRKRLPAKYRGRVLSGMGGIMRGTRILSPAAGGLCIRLWGFPSIYYIQAGLAVTSLVVLLVTFINTEYSPEERSAPHVPFRSYLFNNRRNIAAAMAGITGLQFLRISKNLLFPLWADHIGVSIEKIGLFASIGGAAETLMVIPAGYVFDRFGRKYAAVPCTLGLAVSLALLPFASEPWSLAFIMISMSLFNGLGSGINMTISTDLAPGNSASQFLGLWRVVTDTGNISGPAAAGIIAQVFTLAAAPVAVGCIGIAAAAILLFGMDETIITSEKNK